MKVHRFRRSANEYNYSRSNKYYFTNRVNRYIEYNKRDELYMRCKESARCYMAVGNIPMMLNRLYSTINLEDGDFKYRPPKRLYNQ